MEISIISIKQQKLSMEVVSCPEAAMEQDRFFFFWLSNPLVSEIFRIRVKDGRDEYKKSKFFETVA